MSACFLGRSWVSSWASRLIKAYKNLDQTRARSWLYVEIFWYISFFWLQRLSRCIVPLSYWKGSTNLCRGCEGGQMMTHLSHLFGLLPCESTHFSSKRHVSWELEWGPGRMWDRFDFSGNWDGLPLRKCRFVPGKNDVSNKWLYWWWLSNDFYTALLVGERTLQDSL